MKTRSAQRNFWWKRYKKRLGRDVLLPSFYGGEKMRNDGLFGGPSDIFTVRLCAGDVIINGLPCAQLCWDEDAVGCAIANWLKERNLSCAED